MRIYYLLPTVRCSYALTGRARSKNTKVMGLTPRKPSYKCNSSYWSAQVAETTRREKREREREIEKKRERESGRSRREEEEKE